MMEHFSLFETKLFEVIMHVYKDGWDALIGEVLYCD